MTALAVVGCDSQSATHATSHPQLGSPAPTANAAALAFSAYFSADATDCDEPDPGLGHQVSAAIWKGFTCKNVMTASEVRKHCKREYVGGTGAKTYQPPVTVSAKPKAERFTNFFWQAETQCPGHPAATDQGTYEVTVTQVSGGWTTTAFKILTGPGAGVSS